MESSGGGAGGGGAHHCAGQTSAQVRHHVPLLRYFLAGYRHLRLPPPLRLPLRTTNPVAVVVRDIWERIEPNPSYLPMPLVYHSWG